jgi:hypothetical protein
MNSRIQELENSGAPGFKDSMLLEFRFDSVIRNGRREMSLS